MLSGTYQIADMFCGCGGFSLGFEYAGFKIVYGLDKWDMACESFSTNFPDAEVVCEDALNRCQIRGNPLALNQHKVYIGVGGKKERGVRGMGDFDERVDFEEVDFEELDYLDRVALQKLEEFLSSLSTDELDSLNSDIPVCHVSRDTVIVEIHRYDEDKPLVDDLDETTRVFSIYVDESALPAVAKVLNKYGDFELKIMS